MASITELNPVVHKAVSLFRNIPETNRTSLEKAKSIVSQALQSAQKIFEQERSIENRLHLEAHELLERALPNLVNSATSKMIEILNAALQRDSDSDDDGFVVMDNMDLPSPTRSLSGFSTSPSCTPQPSSLDASRVGTPEDDFKMPPHMELFDVASKATNAITASALFNVAININENTVKVEKVSTDTFRILLPEAQKIELNTENSEMLTSQEKSLFQGSLINVAKELTVTVKEGEILFNPREITLRKKVGWGFLSKTVEVSLLSVFAYNNERMVLGIENILDNYPTIKKIIGKLVDLSQMATTREGHISLYLSPDTFMSFFQ